MELEIELERIDAFLTNLGFRLVRKSVRQKTAVPGIHINTGMTLEIDLTRLLSPGDIFHEAGHVAIVPSLFRAKAKGDIEKSLHPLYERYCKLHQFMMCYKEDPIGRAIIQASEVEAQAWSYAAAVAAAIPPESVFHAQAYNGGGETILAMMSIGRHYGVHGLQAAKMTTVKTYPTMLRWLQI